jgi:hypothetical protein
MIPNINMTIDEADKLIEVNSQLETRMQNGEFEQTPNAHLYSGSGCEKCAREARRKETIPE